VKRAWRITKRRYLASAFDGEGARQFGGRWNSSGHAAIYVSETRALATLEILAGLQAPAVIPAYVLIGVEFDEELITEVEVEALPSNWRTSPPDPATQIIGDRWLARASSLVSRVPSALVPGELNYLINPGHPDFDRLQIGMPEELHLDPRILPR
jgi:RES domain-containing protein